MVKLFFLRALRYLSKLELPHTGTPTPAVMGVEYACSCRTLLRAPAVKGYFAHADLADRIRDRHALAMQNTHLPQLRYNLFRLVASLRHLGPPSKSLLTG